MSEKEAHNGKVKQKLPVQLTLDLCKEDKDAKDRVRSHHGKTYIE